MAPRLTASTAHRLIARPDRWHLAMAWWRVMARRVEQLRLWGNDFTMEARRYGLSVVLDVQYQINRAARELGRPEIDLVNVEEFDRIAELMEANTWPRGWDGTEAAGDALLTKVHRDGSVQPLLGALEVF